MTNCSISGCAKIARARGLCPYHYQAAISAEKPACALCPKPSYAKGLCVNHHHSDWLAKQPQCSIKGCPKRSATGGMCREHYMDANPKARVGRNLSRRKYSRTPKGRWSRFRNSATVRRIAQELTFEQFCDLTSKPCTYCGRFSFNNVSGIDRANNSIGYTIENSVPCCSACNIMKQNLPTDIFLQQAAAIAAHQEKSSK